MTTRRTLLAAGAGLLAAPAVHAQGEWPNRNVRVIVPWPPGGSTDVLVRIYCEMLQPVLGQPVVARLADIVEPIDMVDVFRAADALPDLVDEVLALSPLPKVIWGQLSVRHDAAAVKAEAAGIKVVMDRCPAIEYPRLVA